MDFTFSDEQTLMRDSVSRYLQRDYGFDARQAIVGSAKGWSSDVWARLGEMGLLAAPFPEEVGGLGGSIVDVVAITEVLGAHLVAEPYIGSVVMAGGALAAAPDGTVSAGWLERVVAGEAIGAFAHEEGPGTPDPALVATRAERTAAGGFALTGEKKVVLHGADADVLVVSARLAGEPGDAGGLGLFAVERGTAGLTVTPFTTVDGRRAAHVRFERAEVAADALLAPEAHDLVQRVVARSIVALAAEAVGAMGELLGRTAEYASAREQFGVPIASFQAVAHRLADMKVAHIKARATLLYTTALAEAGRARPHDIAVLKVQAGRLGRTIGESAIQTHGGVGMTDELPIGHLVKRILASEAMFGGTEYHLRTLGAGL
ncbi:MAG: acyl-CoA dehydrogenase [Pseudonocardia sp.]|nr:acyl-CoA dehydrogenase [Pseudonocardia sp.]